MAAEPAQGPFQYFLDERKTIVNDIEQFLMALLRFCDSIEEKKKAKRLAQDVVAGITVIMSRNLHSVIKSLSLLHGLYGYPNSSNQDVTEISIDKGTVRNLANQIRAENEMSLTDYCAEAANGKFWQFDFGPDEVKNLPREPAQVFLNMVRDMLGNTEFAAKIGKKILEDLPDSNYLKPVTWAEYKREEKESTSQHERKECFAFGVSLGVRSYVRPIFLYTKLSQLRKIEDENTVVRLQDFESFRHGMKRKKIDVKTDYSKFKKPCDSCQIFFAPKREYNQSKESFLPFGNCAEYDIIRTKNLDYCLDSPDVKSEWSDIEKACTNQLIAFKNLERELDESKKASGNDMLEVYHTKTRTPRMKVLCYEFSPLQADHKLIALVWPPENN